VIRNIVDVNKITVSELRAPSVFSLVVANLVPLFEVLYLQWDIFPLLFLFWVETVIVGALNVLKMLVSRSPEPFRRLRKMVMIPLFILQYGSFSAFYGVGLLSMFTEVYATRMGHETNLDVYRMSFGQILRVTWDDVWETALVLAASHLFSFFWNYLGKGEYERMSLRDLDRQPYSRMLVMHGVILGGGILILVLGAPIMGLVTLVVLKICFDVDGHLRERRTCAMAQGQDSATQ